MTPAAGRMRPSAVLFGVALGLALGVGGNRVIAQMDAPAEHKGLAVEALGMVPPESVEAQLGLPGHKLQLREITIEPGGQIAKHDHATRPGLVKMISGEWVEGRPEGETTYSEGGETLVEDAETVHWFWNRGDTPATALVCDLVPAG